jgi:hypothetical protein
VRKRHAGAPAIGAVSSAFPIDEFVKRQCQEDSPLQLVPAISTQSGGGLICNFTSAKAPELAANGISKYPKDAASTNEIRRVRADDEKEIGCRCIVASKSVLR